MLKKTPKEIPSSIMWQESLAILQKIRVSSYESLLNNGSEICRTLVHGYFFNWLKSFAGPVDKRAAVETIFFVFMRCCCPFLLFMQEDLKLWSQFFFIQAPIFSCGFRNLRVLNKINKKSAKWIGRISTYNIKSYSICTWALLNRCKMPEQNIFLKYFLLAINAI